MTIRLRNYYRTLDFHRAADSKYSGTITVRLGNYYRTRDFHQAADSKYLGTITIRLGNYYRTPRELLPYAGFSSSGGLQILGNYYHTPRELLPYASGTITVRGIFIERRTPNTW